VPQDIELFRIIVEIGVALVAVTITTFSIAVSILGSERARLQAQIDEIYRSADDRLKRGEIKSFDEAEKEVSRVRSERGKAAQILSQLSLTNVVLLPAGLFAMSIMLAIMVIVGLDTESHLGFPSVALLLVGIVTLVNALSAIEKAAGQPRPATKVVEEAPLESGVVAYIFYDSLEKVIVDWSRKIAYMTDPRTDAAVRNGRVKIIPLFGTNRASFVKAKGLTDVYRSSTQAELPL
jgi:hypothetical protein